MSEVLFNFHDVVLLMTAMQCCFFAVLLIATNSSKNQSNYYLAAFLLAHAFIPLHELILWGEVFKWKMRVAAPNAFFIGGIAYYIDSVLLFFYVKSLIFRDFSLQRRDALHLIPLAVFVVYLIYTYFAHSMDEKVEMIRSESLVYGWHYISFDFFIKSLRLIYCIFALLLIVKYKDILKSTHSNIEKVDITWLKLLVIGFLTVTVLELILSFSKVVGLFIEHNMDVFIYIGLTGYYALFVLVNLLVFTSVRYFSTFEAVKSKEAPKKITNDKVLNPEFAERIDTIMRTEKPYLMPDITLDMLAEKLEIAPKDLSMTINRLFNNNFYEFINNYRIDEAKRLLIDENAKNKTITDIYLEVGFNSKSVFNTFFKKIVGATPSQYRQENKSSG
ncbi:HTH-type transcriptional regulator YesS [Thalassocella blandensis]|nr:HTH-type transcriptional regulator YesS [Thalassocella blandensis]